MSEQEKETITSLDFGIEANGVAGDLKTAEAFLSGDTSALTADADELEEITEEEEGQEGKTEEKTTTKKTQKKAPEKEKPPVDPLGEEFEDDDDEEKEDEGKEDEGEPKKTKKVKEEEEVKEGEDEVNEDLDYKSLAKDLFKIGVFTPVEGEDTDDVKIANGDDLKTRFEKEGQIKATQWLDGFLSRFGDDRRELFDAIFLNALDPKEYMPIYNQYQSFKEADITEEPVQEAVYREYNRRLGWDADKIEKRLQRLKDAGDLEDEAKDMHDQILKQDEERVEAMKEQKTLELATQERIDREYKASIAKILDEKARTKDFDGLPINDKTKNQAFDFLYTKKYKTPDGQTLTEFDKFILDTKRPENHALRVKIALLKLMDFDFSKIEKRGVTKESSSIFQELAQKKSKKSGTSQKKAEISSWFQ